MAVDQEKGFREPVSDSNDHASHSTINQVSPVVESQDPEPVVTLKTWIVACVRVSASVCRSSTLLILWFLALDSLLRIWSLLLACSGRGCHWQYSFC